MKEGPVQDPSIATESSEEQRGTSEVPSKPQPLRPGRLSRLQWLMVWCLAGAIFLPNAGAFGLWDPWETHYGEVTRNMVETSDWVSPYWGFRSKVGTEPVAGKAFFSKPVFLFWIEAATSKIIGLSDWSIRLPVALIAMAVLATLAHCLARIFSPLTAMVSVFVVGTSPQFFFLGRQAQTDMPFVGMMSIALLFAMLGLFGVNRERSRKKFWALFGSAMAIIALSTFPQYGLIATDLFLEGEGENVGLWATLWGNGIYHVMAYIILLLAFGLSVFFGLRRDLAQEDYGVVQERWGRRAYLWLFYVFCAHATLAKGLLGFLLPGAILFVFLLVTWGWRRIKEMEVPRGLLLFIAVGFPWYFAMFSKHGMAYYNRFFIHDHFNRMNAGVHQIDSGTFEHFLKWLSFGMWPWIAFAPVALMYLLSRAQKKTALRLEPVHWFTLLWFFVSYTVFTSSSTKFHHYIFPALLPLGILIGEGIIVLMRERGPAIRLGILVAGCLLGAIGWNISENPQTLRNLFTYKYDRPMPDHMPTHVDEPVADGAEAVWGDSVFYEETNAFILQAMNQEFLGYESVLMGVTGICLAGLFLFVFVRTRPLGMGLFGAGALFLALWGLNVYLATFSTHWSQKYLFESYYADCNLREQPQAVEDAYEPLLGSLGLGDASLAMGAKGKRVCEEDIISWLITWRGETYYGNNEVIPIQKEATQFESYLRDYNRGKSFYVLMERGKEESWTKKLNSTYLPKVKEDKGFGNVDKFTFKKIYDENRYFILVRIEPQSK